MSIKRILYLGDDSPSSTSKHRTDALKRLGILVTVVNPENLLGPFSRWQDFLHFRTGYRFLQKRLRQRLTSCVLDLTCLPDLIWVNSGELLGPKIINWLKSHFRCPILLYQNDDPLGHRDGNRFLSLRDSIPYYDLCVFVRFETELEALAVGAKRVLRVLMSYDELRHSPPLSFEGGPSLESSVSFIGTLIPGEQRDSTILTLLKAGLPISLIGGRWQRSPNWPALKGIYKGPAISGSSYAHALATAAVSLGFLSHHNRDLITQRSLETPACGGLLCAERTSEHQLLYEDGQEAVFWSSTPECIQQCRNLLADSGLNQRVRTFGHLQVLRLGCGNEDICRQILAAL